MIGLILGTSEGKIILEELTKHTNNLFVSTATTYGGELLKDFNIKYLNTEPLTRDELLNKANELGLRLILDGTHPYAKEISENILYVCKELKIDYLRYERKGALKDFQYNNIIRISELNELIDIDKQIKGPILNTLGGNTLGTIINLNLSNRIIHRVLPAENIIKKMLDLNIKIEDIIAIKGPINKELNKSFLNQYGCDAILTKDSGISGGALEKAMAARETGAKLIILEKPEVNYGKTMYDLEEVISYLINY